MKTKILLFLFLCFASLSMMGQGTIVREKCKTCGKVLSQCQYKGKHPTPSETNNGSKPEQKPQKKQTSAKTSETKKTKTPSKTNSRKESKQTSNTKQGKKQALSSNSPKTKKPSSGYENGHEWVDLGLSVKWATCNVGANNPSDYGGYYAWGETSTKSRYDWSNYFDCLDSKGKNWGIYKIGGQTRITPSSGHDAARENWGGSWRLPSITEFNELCKKCKWTWTIKDGHYGYIVTGSNGNCIFLPVAGLFGETKPFQVGERSGYWANSLDKKYSDYACDLFLSEMGYGLSSDSRNYGCSVRPVKE